MKTRIFTGFVLLLLFLSACSGQSTPALQTPATVPASATLAKDISTTSRQASPAASTGTPVEAAASPVAPVTGGQPATATPGGINSSTTPAQNSEGYLNELPNNLMGNLIDGATPGGDLVPPPPILAGTQPADADATLPPEIVAFATKSAATAVPRPPQLQAGTQPAGANAAPSIPSAGTQSGGANAAPPPPLTVNNLSDFFLAINPTQCVTFDDNNALTTQAVHCKFPEADAYYFMYRNREAQNIQFDDWNRLTTEGTDILSSTDGSWYGATSQFEGFYSAFLWNGKATIMWKVDDLLLSGFATRNDNDQQALKTWWETKGNSHPGSQNSQLGTSSLSLPSSPSLPGNQPNAAPAHDNSPEGRLASYFVAINANYCAPFDDGNPQSLASDRCEFQFQQQNVTVEYIEWGNEQAMNGYFTNRWFQANTACDTSSWTRKDAMHMPEDMGTFFQCTTADNQHAVIYWDDRTRYMSGFAVADNNDLSSLYNEWSQNLSRVNIP